MLCFTTLSEGLQPARPPEFPVRALGVRAWCDAQAGLADVFVGTITGAQVCSESMCNFKRRFLQPIL